MVMDDRRSIHGQGSESQGGGARCGFFLPARAGPSAATTATASAGARSHRAARMRPRMFNRQPRGDSERTVLAEGERRRVASAAERPAIANGPEEKSESEGALA